VESTDCISLLRQRGSSQKRCVERFWPHLDKQSVIALFDMIQLEFGISAGLLRPGDSLEKLCRPVETLNPLKWLVFQMKANDKKTELNRELGRRLNRYGTRDKWNSIATVDDLVRAWSGDIPSPMDR